MVLVRHAADPQPLIGEGYWWGEIRAQARGHNGFGYDPHFYLPELGKTAAELDQRRRTGCRTAARRCANWSKNCAAFLNRNAFSRCAYAVAPSSFAAGRKAEGAAAAVAVRAHPLVREEMPLLRLQFARGPGRGAGAGLCPGADRRPGTRAAADLGPARVLDVFRRRHAQPVLGRGDRGTAGGRSAPGSISPPMRKSRWRPIRARSSRPSSTTTAPAGSTACRSASRASIRRTCRRSGRIHDGDEARRAIGIAQAHFDNINLDLMYALPRQTLQEAEQDIDTAAGFGTTHLSAYHLTWSPTPCFTAIRRRCPMANSPPTCRT